MRLPNNSHIVHGFAFCNDLATVKNMTFVAQKNTKMVGECLIPVYPGPL